MELTKNYEAATTEQKWTEYWAAHQLYKSTPNHLPAYSVVIPPPNVTGVLHMGHTLNETVQDILVRRARMTGYNACWVPGSDHASIATEAKIVQVLKEQGIDKNTLTRPQFLEHAFAWKEKYGNIIYDQIKKLGCSVDWDRVSFTMDHHYYQSVLQTFETLYNKGLIYRGARMINWDVAAKTALSDEEVEYKDIEGKLYYIKYYLAPENGNNEKTTTEKGINPQVVELKNSVLSSSETRFDHLPNNANNTSLVGFSNLEKNELEFPYITIATQRPETIMGDTAICFNPNDERYKHLAGKKVLIPLLNKAIPIIYDEYVDPTFGTGGLKVTPAHDINDYNLGLKHGLDVIDTLNDDGNISEAAQLFVGIDRFKARKLILQELTKTGQYSKEESYPSRIGYSQRTGVVVEPKISTQWFLKMADLAKPALEAVTSGKIKIYPSDRFLATYKHWLENVKDWCISRQLWWGQQIPAWYDDKGNMVVAPTKVAAQEKYELQYGTANATLTQDADVLDTWFSSWLWPIEVFKGISDPNNADFKYYYPTATLVTGQDIIFFWVARMVMAGLYFKNEIPFTHVYFTGMVRDKQGRKMSKQLGNSPELLLLIQQYGADAVRFGIMISSPAGNDLLFDEGSLEQGKFFTNKLWNALKLLKMWEEQSSNSENSNAENKEDHFAITWFENRLAEASQEIAEQLKNFKLSEALKTTYSLIWNDYCSWYLEWVKPEYGTAIHKEILQKTFTFFEQLMALLHPFMPFITEEIYSLLAVRKNAESLSTQQLQPTTISHPSILQQGIHLQNTITAIRDIRNKQQLKPKETIQVALQSPNTENYKNVASILQKQVVANAIIFTNKEIENSISVVQGTDTFYITSPYFKQDATASKAEMQKELERLTTFLQSTNKKLENEKFVANAKPEVLELEQKKKADAEEKIKVLEGALKS